MKELRRYTIRPDGFMALSADAKGHETVTRPFRFQGGKLSLKVSTAAVHGRLNTAAPARAISDAVVIAHTGPAKTASLDPGKSG